MKKKRKKREKKQRCADECYNGYSLGTRRSTGGNIVYAVLLRLAVSGLSVLFKTDFSPVARSSIEQLIKLTIFVIYVWAVSFMKDIKRCLCTTVRSTRPFFAMKADCR